MKAFTLPNLSMLALAGVLAFSACKKDEETVPEDMTVSAEDNARIETEMESVQNFVDAEAAEPDMMNSNVSKSGNLSACATRNWDSVTHKLTIDFGPNNCLCRDGRYRRGQIVAVFNGPWRTAGASVTITLLNYFVDDNQHTGTKVITFLENENGSGNFKYHVDVQNASIIFTNGTARSWTAQRDVERTAGQGTPTILDDEYLVTGSSSGTNRRGVQFSAVIGQPLKKVFRTGCARNFIAGTISITNSNQKSMLLNYDPAGTEACDKTASVTINGKTKIITLR